VVAGAGGGADEAQWLGACRGAAEGGGMAGFAVAQDDPPRLRRCGACGLPEIGGAVGVGAVRGGGDDADGQLRPVVRG
jgi:hypothetical protein